MDGVAYTIDYDTWSQMVGTDAAYRSKKEAKAEWLEITADTMDELGSAIDEAEKKYGAGFSPQYRLGLIGDTEKKLSNDIYHRGPSFPARVKGKWVCYLGRLTTIKK